MPLRDQSHHRGVLRVAVPRLEEFHHKATLPNLPEARTEPRRRVQAIWKSFGETRKDTNHVFGGSFDNIYLVVYRQP